MKKIGELRNKKGLSDVITTVLIILLVLAAVIIIWVFVNPAIKKSASQVTGDCVTLNVNPVSCDVNGTDATVKIQRSSGEGNLKVLQYVFTVNGDNKVRNATATLGQLESQTNIFSYGPGKDLSSEPSTFTVAGVIQTDSGAMITCPASSQPATCA